MEIYNKRTRFNAKTHTHTTDASIFPMLLGKIAFESSQHFCILLPKSDVVTLSRRLTLLTIKYAASPARSVHLLLTNSLFSAFRPQFRALLLLFSVFSIGHPIRPPTNHACKHIWSKFESQAGVTHTHETVKMHCYLVLELHNRKLDARPKRSDCQPRDKGGNGQPVRYGLRPSDSSVTDYDCMTYRRGKHIECNKERLRRPNHPLQAMNASASEIKDIPLANLTSSILSLLASLSDLKPTESYLTPSAALFSEFSIPACDPALYSTASTHMLNRFLILGIYRKCAKKYELPMEHSCRHLDRAMRCFPVPTKL